MAFMRMYGLAGDPGPRPAPRRKSAAAGPRAKAGRKRAVRAQRASRGKHGAPKGPGKKKGKGGGIDFAKIGSALAGGIPFVGGAASELVNQLTAQGVPPDQAVEMAVQHHAKKGGGGKHRRSNPTNVRALRRSLRRVEGFGRLVSRVNKMLPRAHHFQVHPVLKHKRRKRA